MSRRTGQRTLLTMAAAAILGLAAGLGGFTFHHGEGTSYLVDDPASCINCHVMEDQYESWSKSSHARVATCNSCHVPRGAIMKWVSKADNGFWHSWAFTFQNHPDPIQIKPRNRRIAQDNCVACHSDFVHEMRPEQRSDRDGAKCMHCHMDAGHAAWR